jgi:hypothetical protein
MEKEQYHVEISNRFSLLENLDTEVDSTLGNIERKSTVQPKRC